MKKLLPAAADVVLVLVFCAIGRRSHDETGALAGLAHTAWPFLGGLAAGWAASIALYKEKFAPFSVVPAGVVIWFSTLLIGMVLRVLSGQGTAFSFVVVAAIVLGLFLIGWRFAYGKFSGRRTSDGRKVGPFDA